MKTALTSLRVSGICAMLAVLITGCTSKPKEVAAPPSAFWPSYPDEPRIQFLVSFESSKDVEPEKSSLDKLVYGKENESVLALKKPYGVDMYNGKIYVCDLRNAALTVLDLRNRKTLVLGRTGGDTLTRPSDIVISDDGYKYVSDVDKGKIFVFDPNERAAGSFGLEGLKPTGLAVHGDELYVCNFTAQRVEVFNRRTGKATRYVGEKGMGDGQFIRPLGIAVDKNANLFVADVMKCTVQKFDPTGKFVRQFGTISNNAGGLVRPKQMAIDNDGTLYVVDAAFQNVQLFNELGQVYTFFGSPGSHPGAMYLPAGICVHDGDLDIFAKYINPAFDAKRLIIVTNQFGLNKVSVYAMGQLKPGKTVKDIAASQGIVPEGTMSTTQPIMPEPVPQPGDLPDTNVQPATKPATPERK
jgi:streptogramin lyase